MNNFSIRDVLITEWLEKQINGQESKQGRKQGSKEARREEGKEGKEGK